MSFRFWFTDLEGKNPLELKYVIDVVGLGVAPVELTTSSRALSNDGSVVTNARFVARPFTAEFDIRDSEGIEEMRRVGEYFGDNKPKTFFTQEDADDEPKCLTPVYLNDAINFDVTDGVIKNMIMSFIAPDPLFKIIKPNSSEIYDEPSLEFDLDIPSGGVEFSVISSKLGITNNGSRNADTIIRFTGGVNHPTFTNETTGEHFSVSRNIAASEVLEINSATGRVDVIDSNGVRHNAFNYIGDNDDFITLAKGLNIISYTAISGTTGALEVGIIEYYATV